MMKTREAKMMKKNWEKPTLRSISIKSTYGGKTPETDEGPGYGPTVS
jgi:hypothetical protein